MNMIDLVSEVSKINIEQGNAGLFVWFISHNVGGIGRDYYVGKAEWNVVPGFSNDSEMILTLARLKVKYEMD